MLLSESDIAMLTLHGVWTHADNLVGAHVILASDQKRNNMSGSSSELQTTHGIDYITVYQDTGKFL